MLPVYLYAGKDTNFPTEKEPYTGCAAINSLLYETLLHRAPLLWI